MSADDIPVFHSKEDEVNYWKNKATEYKQGMKITREELLEFQEQSRELEQELEIQLDHAEKSSKDMQMLCTRVQNENENLRESIEQMRKEYNSQLNSLEEDLRATRTQLENWHKYIRELEQSNDDLERSQRVMVASIEDFEAKLNILIERNAFLESELDEKESLRAMVQRFKDEARDLKQELKVRDNTEVPSDLESSRIELIPKVTQNSPFSLGSYLSTQMEGLKLSSPHAVSDAMSPSARICALNIVDDLIRGVSALEGKVANARATPVRDTPRTPRFRPARFPADTDFSHSTPPASDDVSVNDTLP